jgi:hypothetical protein
MLRRIFETAYLPHLLLVPPNPELLCVPDAQNLDDDDDVVGAGAALVVVVVVVVTSSRTGGTYVWCRTTAGLE